MRFIEWLRLDELSDPRSIDSSGVELEVYGRGGYRHEFSVVAPGGAARSFVVYLRPKPRSVVHDIELPWQLAAWDVSFRGESTFRLTGESGSSAVAVYSRVLAAVKRLTEVERVDALIFEAFDSRTVPIYDRFVRRLSDFVQVDNDTYVREPVLRSMMSMMSPEDAGRLEAESGDSRRRRSDWVSFIKSQKSQRGLASPGGSPAPGGGLS